MMRAHTKRYLDAAVDELKRDGYMVLVLTFDKHEYGCICDGIMQNPKCPAHKQALEVLCSETNNPLIIQEMAKAALEGLSQQPKEAGQKASPVN